jgi:hypothetical protein
MGRKPKILTGCLLFLCLLAFSASSAAQTRTISIQAENQTVASVLKTIEQQSGYTFFYNDAAFDKSRRISISASGKDVLDVVREVFRGSPRPQANSKRQPRGRYAGAWSIPTDCRSRAPRCSSRTPRPGQ